MKEKCAIWYVSQITAGLVKGLAVDEIDVKTPLATMKPLHAKRIMNLYDEITSEKAKEIVLNDRKAAGDIEAVEMGSAKLICLDPFNDIDPLGGDSISFEDDIQFPTEGNLDLMNARNQIQTMNMFWITKAMPSMQLLFRSSSILANFLKHLICFTLIVKAYT